MKIAVLGNIAGVAQEIVVGLRERGIAADLFMSQQEYAVAMDDLPHQFDFKGAAVHILDPGPSGRGPWARVSGAVRKSTIAATLMRYDLIHAHTGSLSFSLLSHLMYVRGGLRPYLAFATGSDFREMARFDQGRNGRLMREFFHNASEVLLLNTDMIRFKDELGLPQARFFPFLINEQKYSPRQSSRTKDPNRVDLFMMSNLDFGITDARPGRNSMKANDNVLRALALFVAGGGQAHLIIKDRGPDREVAKCMTVELGLSAHVTFERPQSEEDRIRQLADADIVFDQFHIGAFGLGSLESMAMGKPLVTYLPQETFSLCYGKREAPFINAKEPEEILKALWRLRDPAARKKVSANARAFILEYHSRAAVIPQLEKCYARCAPGLV